MEFVGDRKIKLDRVLSDLDEFVLEFTKILGKHSRYVIVSGYVSILFGRARGTEDVDVYVPKMAAGKFRSLYNELVEKGFWCLNAGDADGAYDYLADGLAVRFAKNDEVIPNIELKFALKKLAKDVFEDAITVETVGGDLIISSLERQIAFKRYFLKSEKDLEDAAHVEELFREHLNTKKIIKYKKLIGNEET